MTFGLNETVSARVTPETPPLPDATGTGVIGVGVAVTAVSVTLVPVFVIDVSTFDVSTN